MLNFEQIKEKVLEINKEKGSDSVVAFACAADKVTLETAKLLNESGIGNAILVGDEDKIRSIAKEVGLEVDRNIIINKRTNQEAAMKAVETCVDGVADVLCKGHLHTSMYLRAILNKERGMRTGQKLCSVTAVDSPVLGRMFLASDCAMIVSPSLEEKQAIINHATELSYALGTPMPKVALLSAVEDLNKNMPDGYEAAVLSMMNQRGQIKNCIVDGPLSLDLALSPYSAKNKGVDSEVAGHADIIVMPNIQAGNIFWKSMTYLANTTTGAVVMGASKPVVLTSRSDGPINKLDSIAMALLLENYQSTHSAK